MPEMLILPGNIAFFLSLSLAPLITLFGLIASSLSLSITSIISFFNNVIPKEIISIFVPLVDGSGLKTINVVFVIVGFFVASNGSHSIILASNVLYKQENSKYLNRKIKSLFLTVWLIILFLSILLIMAFGSFILTKLLNVGVLGTFIRKNYLIITITKLLLAFLLIFMTIKIVYTMAPDIKLKSKYVNIGALTATLLIMIVTSLFSFYVNNIAHYDVIYGNLASIAILLLLIYIISYIIVLGIAINHSYYAYNNE